MTRRYHKRSKRIDARELTDDQRDDLIHHHYRKLGEKKPSSLVDPFKRNELPLWGSLKDREDAWRNIREEFITDYGSTPYCAAWWDYEAPPGIVPGQLTGRYTISDGQVEPEEESDETLLRRLHLLSREAEAGMLLEKEKRQRLNMPPCPTFTWEEILAMKGKYNGDEWILGDDSEPEPLTLYVECWEEPNLPLPLDGKGNPPDWEAIRAELDKGPDQDIAPIIQAYLDQLGD